MNSRWQLLSLLVGIIALIISFMAVRKRKLSEDLAVFWLILSLLIIFIVTNIGLLKKFSVWLGIIDANNLILLLCIMFLISISFYFSIKISRMEKRFIILLQEHALLKKDKT
jgi:hypothetical protein